jgi:hypothetical protein
VITNIYIDGFNLYYGALKGTAYKWLNPLDLCRVALKKYHVFHRLRYFTAKVLPRPHDPGQPLRQSLYLRALQTLPNVSIHLGHFLVHNIRMPLTSNPAHKVEVVKVEEKGSDVNLATHLLNDAHMGDFACAVVISSSITKSGTAPRSLSLQTVPGALAFRQPIPRDLGRRQGDVPQAPGMVIRHPSRARPSP